MQIYSYLKLEPYNLKENEAEFILEISFLRYIKSEILDFNYISSN